VCAAWKRLHCGIRIIFPKFFELGLQRRHYTPNVAGGTA
jgi:hypothetical protein